MKNRNRSSARVVSSRNGARSALKTSRAKVVKAVKSVKVAAKVRPASRINLREIARNGFKVGSKVIYPSHGLGIIEKIEEREVAGSEDAFFIIRLQKNGMTIMAPIRSAQVVGLRQIIATKEVPKIMRILRNGVADQDLEPNWNKRQKAFLDKIKTGSLTEVASVYRTLFKLKESKGLSFVEQQVFENAHHLIVSEIAEAKGINEDKAVKLVGQALAN